MSYQKITDLFIATSTDYNPKSEEAYTFFKIVQNKLHFAISGHTLLNLFILELIVLKIIWDLLLGKILLMD